MNTAEKKQPAITAGRLLRDIADHGMVPTFDSIYGHEATDAWSKEAQDHNDRIYGPVRVNDPNVMPKNLLVLHQSIVDAMLHLHINAEDMGYYLQNLDTNLIEQELKDQNDFVDDSWFSTDEIAKEFEAEGREFLR